MANLSPAPKLQFFDANGNPLVGGKLYSYQAGTTTPLATFTDAGGATPNANPIILDSRGEANVWLSSALYKLALYTSTNVLVWTVDNVGGPDQSTLAQLATSGGAGLVGFSYAQNYVVSTVGWSLKNQLGIDITQAPYLADKTGAASSSAAITAAIAANPGIPLYAPAGTYRLDTEVAYVPTVSGVFGPGFQINGAGSNVTIFDTRVSNGFAFRLATTTLGTFQHSASFTNLQITTLGAPAVAGGLSLRSVYTINIQGVWIKNLSGDGIRVIMSNGDQDGSNMITLRHVRIETCAGWGFNTLVTGPYNEFSFLRLDQVFIQNCGTASATVPPPSGGMRWKGQVFSAVNSAFVICQNVGLYIEGGAGLSNTVSIDSCTWENNVKKSFYCTGLDGLSMESCQFYNNDSFVGQTQCEIDGASFAIRRVAITDTIIRATAGNNPITAFKLSGANVSFNTCRVTGTVWGNFDHPGQTRFDGWQFDQVQQNCQLVALSTTSLVLRPSTAFGTGNKTPLRLRGGFGGSPSTSGEWVEHQLPSSGVGISNASLAANTRYYCYLFDNNGVVALELSTTAFATDAAYGYAVKTGDATRLYVGSVQTDAGSLFLLTAGGWLNPTLISSTQVGVPNYLWCDSTGDLRVKNAIAPTSDTDGTVVGTQT
jgi:hypothetical protein